MCDIKSEYILVLDFWIEIVKMQSVTSGEWGCPLDNDANSAMGQPNRGLKKTAKCGWYQGTKAQLV